jgi:hypothetical protein
MLKLVPKNTGKRISLAQVKKKYKANVKPVTEKEEKHIHRRYKVKKNIVIKLRKNENNV